MAPGAPARAGDEAPGDCAARGGGRGQGPGAQHSDAGEVVVGPVEDPWGFPMGKAMGKYGDFSWGVTMISMGSIGLDWLGKIFLPEAIDFCHEDHGVFL